MTEKLYGGLTLDVLKNGSRGGEATVIADLADEIERLQTELKRAREWTPITDANRNDESRFPCISYRADTGIYSVKVEFDDSPYLSSKSITHYFPMPTMPEAK